MSLSSCFFILLLVLPLSLIRCCCSFFSICHFLAYIYLQFSYPHMWHFLFVNFPVIHPRHDKPTVVCLLFSKFNSFQMLEFDDSWKLMTTRNFPILSGIVPDEKPFTSFLSFFCSSIVPDKSNTSILISLTNLLSCLSFSNNWESLLLISSTILSQGFLSSTFWNPGWAPMLCMAVLGIWVSLRVV